MLSWPRVSQEPDQTRDSHLLMAGASAQKTVTVPNKWLKGWAQKWRENGWWRNKKAKASNIDLWEKLIALCNKHQVEFEWVKGHAGLDANERCDELSMAALKQPNLPADEGYEQRPEDSSASKITQEGQSCRKCLTPVVKKVPRRKQKPAQTYYYEYYLYCPNCRTMYMVEEAKRYFENQPLL